MNRFSNISVRNSFLYLLCILFLTEFQAAGQNKTENVKQNKPIATGKNIPLFNSDKLLNVTLNLDLTSFSKKPSKGDAFDAVMTIHFSETDSVNINTIINYRGTSRFQICSFPPMQLNFKPPLQSGSGRIKKLKLITHCEPGILSDEYILREYLVYKMYNILTDTSFKVRLLKVKYIDSKKNKKAITKYGIFVEPIELLAERNNATVVKSPNLIQQHIEPAVMDRVAIFNYMISNWDWSVTGQHNVAVIKKNTYGGSDLGLAVPYDFDLTGVVNADYAIPPAYLGIENIRERLFYGICRSKEVYQEDLKKFLSKKEELYSAVNDFPELNQRSKKDITTFLDQFFDKLQKQKSLDTMVELFLYNCKKQ
jgi:hypothetical protein